MPALNFKKEFADKVEAGEKTQTIRALRIDCNNPRAGQTLYLYTGMRTKGCRKLGEGICTSVEPIHLAYITNGIILNCEPLSDKKELELVHADGFNNIVDFYNFFRKAHGLPFWGLLIKWELKKIAQPSLWLQKKWQANGAKTGEQGERLC